jgi:hypothetical protein
MKRRFTILTAAFALLAFLAIPMGMRGQTSVTWPGTTALPGTATAVANDQNVTIMVSATNTYSNPIRIYANTTVTINALNNAKILSVAYEASSTGNYVTNAQNATVTPNVTPTVSGKIVTWTYTESANVTEFTFTPSAQTRSNGITISYIIPGATPTCATPTFSPAAGTYTQAQNVSINCSTDGATIYYTIDGNDPTTNSSVYSGAINVSTNTTIKAMATATGYDNSAVATAEYAFITLEHAGTLEDPYSVADARAAIDANAGTQGVYATGIVSAIVTAYDAGFHNVTFNMVDEAGDEVFLQAYRCGGDEAANVAVGDVAVVYGNLTKFGSTYEFGQGCTLVSLTHPVITTPVVTVTPNTIDAPFAGADGTLALTYENIENFISFDYYFCDANGGELEGNDPDWIYAQINEENDAYTLDYIIDANQGEARTAYIKVYTFDDNEEEVYAIVTVNQEAYVAPTYAELPFSFNGGKADIEETDGLSQEGLGTDYASAPKLKFDGAGDWLLLQFDERPGTLTFDIKGNSFSGGTFKVQTSADGVSYSDLETYTTFGNNETLEEIFDNLDENVRYIKWVYTNKSSGNVGLGNIALAKYVAPALVSSITVNPDEVNVDATPAAGEDFIEGTLDLTWENLEITDFFEDFAIQYYDAEGEELADDPNWIMVDLATQDPNIGEGYLVSYMIEENEGTEARTAYFKVFALGDEDYVYSNLVTITQAAHVAPPTPGTWVLTNLADLTADDVFVIVGDNGDTYAMSNDKGTSVAPAAVAVTVVENTLSAEPAANLQWNISITEDGYTFYPNGETETWLYCTNSNNGVRVGTNTNNVFVIDEESGYLKNFATSRYIGIYDSQDWRCYTSINNNIAGQSFAFYKKVAAATETYTLDITGYEAGSNGGYYLIASPVTVDPEEVEGMTTDDFDLYYFDEAEDNEWRNYEANAFNLVPGKGYLYAKQATTEGEIFHFELTGTPYDGNGTIELNYTEGGDFPGWNLIGNPYNEEAGLNLPFYRMNTEGTEVEPVSQGTVNPMEGVFVIAQTDPETGDIINAQFTAGMGSNSGDEKLVLNVSRNRGNVVDRAIVRFGQGGVLPKFQLNENNTKLYIVEGENEYAVVRSANEGEMPVNFKASENGTYTLSVNAENVEMEYLHLIDNMTGTDVDLLATPSYSFEARTNDYESRFRLVFSGNTNVGSSTNSETFAFFNGNSWVINNEGEATLQVIDMMGRVLSNEQINGSYNNSLNLSAGVYVLRLSNGNTVKTQKVVVD